MKYLAGELDSIILHLWKITVKEDENERFHFQQMNNKKCSEWKWCQKKEWKMTVDGKKAHSSKKKDNDDDDDDGKSHQQRQQSNAYTIFNENWHWVRNYKCSSFIALFSCIWSNVECECELWTTNVHSVRLINEANKLQLIEGNEKERLNNRHFRH